MGEVRLHRIGALLRNVLGFLRVLAEQQRIGEHAVVFRDFGVQRRDLVLGRIDIVFQRFQAAAFFGRIAPLLSVISNTPNRFSATRVITVVTMTRNWGFWNARLQWPLRQHRRTLVMRYIFPTTSAISSQVEAEFFVPSRCRIVEKISSGLTPCRRRYQMDVAPAVFESFSSAESISSRW